MVCFVGHYVSVMVSLNCIKTLATELLYFVGTLYGTQGSNSLKYGCVEASYPATSAHIWSPVYRMAALLGLCVFMPVA